LERLKRDVFEFLEADIPRTNKIGNELMKGRVVFLIVLCKDDPEHELIEEGLLSTFEMRAADFYLIKEPEHILLNVIDETKRRWLSVSASDAIEDVFMSHGDSWHADWAVEDWEVRYVCVVVVCVVVVCVVVVCVVVE
jgi:hypothetical protein